MGKKNMVFDDAYKMLADRRPIIAPNFNFLAQLSEYGDEVSHRSSSGANSLCSSGDYENPVSMMGKVNSQPIATTEGQLITPKARVEEFRKDQTHTETTVRS